MRTIGAVIKEARVKKKYSRAKLEKETRIKKEFVRALEEGDWDVLPELPVVQGFVKNIASVLSVNQKQILALLRRDYPPRSLRINPKPDVESKFTWSPKLTFLAGVIVVSAIVLAYLGLQYINFVKPPTLSVDFPKEGQLMTKKTLEVSGRTNPEAVVKVSNQPVLVDEDGKFSAEIEIFEGTTEVIVKATSRSGKETVVRRSIRVELVGP